MNQDGSQDKPDCATERRILHVDMDAFYASVEQRDNPELRGKPVAVGGGSQRGVVAAASYEARAFGVRSAMPSVTARRRCPELVFVRPRFEVYAEVSRTIRSIFNDYTTLVQPLSLDEAYLDVTVAVPAYGSATAIAREIKERILNETGLTASAGVSINKFIAKVASGMNKPDGLTVVRPEQIHTFISRLPIERFFGVGAVTAEKFHKLGIRTGADLLRVPLPVLEQRFGRSGSYFYRMARGDDNRPVTPHRIRKSLGAERTFFENIVAPSELEEKIVSIADRVWERVERAEVSGRTVTVKIKYHDFEIRTRSRSFDQALETADELQTVAVALLQTPAWPDRPVRLLGVTLSSLLQPGDVAARQLRLPLA